MSAQLFLSCNNKQSLLALDVGQPDSEAEEDDPVSESSDEEEKNKKHSKGKAAANPNQNKVLIWLLSFVSKILSFVVRLRLGERNQLLLRPQSLFLMMYYYFHKLITS